MKITWHVFDEVEPPSEPRLFNLLVCPSCRYAEVDDGGGLTDDWCGHAQEKFERIQAVEVNGLVSW